MNRHDVEELEAASIYGTSYALAWRDRADLTLDKRHKYAAMYAAEVVDEWRQRRLACRDPQREG